jgi:hypothetical protein
MASTAGRLLRVVAGAVLLFIGWKVVGGAAGEVLATIGLVPIVTGTFNVCLLGPMLGAPFSGRTALGTGR